MWEGGTTVDNLAAFVAHACVSVVVCLNIVYQNKSITDVYMVYVSVDMLLYQFLLQILT